MDNPRPEFRPRGNDKATIPMDMLHIEPPEGTKMFQIGAISGEGKRVNISGVKEIAYVVIRTFEERPGDEAQYAEGTFIHYEPRLNQIHVARRGLTADEINRI